MNKAEGEIAKAIRDTLSMAPGPFEGIYETHTVPEALFEIAGAIRQLAEAVEHLRTEGRGPTVTRGAEGQR